MTPLRTTRDLLTAMRHGWRLVQVYEERWAGGQKRDQFALESDGGRIEVPSGLIKQAQRHKQIEPVSDECDGVSPRPWKLTQKVKQK